MLLTLLACQPGDGSSTVATREELPESPDINASPESGTPTVSILGSLEYEVQESFAVVNHGPGQPSKHNVWVALIGDHPPYQAVRSMEITPADYEIVEDEYGNRYAEFDLAGIPPGGTLSITMDYRVVVNELGYDLAVCEGEVPEIYNQAELHIESNNPQIKALAGELSSGKRTACDAVRAFYDYIGDNLVYTYNGANWGAQAALGEMGADCTEYASLMIALSRALGLPARYLEGLYFSQTEDPIARTEHAWTEIFLQGTGWVPVDPTLGRFLLDRGTYFARYKPDRIIVTRGRSPSVLRGGSYYTHIYWPGNSTQIEIEDFAWRIVPVEN